MQLQTSSIAWRCYWVVWYLPPKVFPRSWATLCSHRALQRYYQCVFKQCRLRRTTSCTTRNWVDWLPMFGLAYLLRVGSHWARANLPCSTCRNTYQPFKVSLCMASREHRNSQLIQSWTRPESEWMHWSSSLQHTVSLVDPSDCLQWFFANLTLNNSYLLISLTLLPFSLPIFSFISS